MQDKIVELDPKRRARGAPMVSDFWFAQVENRLGRIETLIRRLEWQIWMIVCGAGALLLLELVRVIAPERI